MEKSGESTREASRFAWGPAYREAAPDCMLPVDRDRRSLTLVSHPALQYSYGR